MSAHSTTENGLWSRDLLVLLAIAFLAYANISVFFRYYPYLQTLPINPGRLGVLIGAFSAVSLILRPLISPWFNTANSRGWIMIGTMLVIVSLGLYSLVHGFWGMLTVRCLHGLAFVVMGSALMALIVAYIPLGRSSQVFGIISIVVMLPNTVVPPLWPLLERFFGGFTNVLLAFSILTALIFPLVVLTGRGQKMETGSPSLQRLTWPEIRSNLGDLKLVAILSAMFFLYCGVSVVFFFVADLARTYGLSGVGIFFMITTMGEIGVRLAAGQTFDRLPKAMLLALTLILLAVAYAVLARGQDQGVFFVVAVVLGLGWGAAMPVFNGLVFDVSAPRYRAFNTNLGLQMFQAGFFLGPIMGGMILDHWHIEWLYFFTAAINIVAAAIMFGVARTSPLKEEQQ
jgi:predicted MFS family arabinose efflux permease